MKLLVAFIAVLMTLLACDALWLGLAYKPLYMPAMGHLLSPQVNIAAAAAFYALYAFGLSWLIVLPAKTHGDTLDLSLRAGLFGVVAYATYDLTALSVLRDWPLALSLIDMAWGGLITVAAANVACFALKLIRTNH